MTSQTDILLLLKTLDILDYQYKYHQDASDYNSIVLFISIFLYQVTRITICNLSLDRGMVPTQCIVRLYNITAQTALLWGDVNKVSHFHCGH